MNQSNVISLRVSQPASAGSVMYLRPNGYCSSMAGKQLIPTASVSIANNTITVADNGLERDLKLKYFHGGGAAIAGLANDTAYYVVPKTLQEFYLSAAVSKAITGASIASPMAITCAGHGFANGSQVHISGVKGTTNANGTFTATSTSADTFTIPVDNSAGGANLTYVAALPSEQGKASKAIALTGVGTVTQYLEHQGLADKAIGVLIHDVNDEESGNPAAIQLFNHGILLAEATGPIASGDIVGVSDLKNHVLTGANDKAIGWSLESLASGAGTVRVITN